MSTTESEEIDSQIGNLKEQVYRTWDFIKELENRGLNVDITFPKKGIMIKPSIQISKEIYSEQDIYKPLLTEFEKGVLLF